jgi:hypothetical protein
MDISVSKKYILLFARVIKKSSLCLLFGGLITTSLLLAGNPKPAQGATSSTLNFQARLMQSSGAIVSDGNYHIEFKIYNASSSAGSSQGSCSGDSNCKWTETRTTGNLVRVVNGYMTVNLGSVTSLPSINWDQDLWLTMNIGGKAGSATWDGEMSPRLKLTAVPYAFRAGQLAKLTGANTSTLDFATQTAANSILLPDEAGTLCIRNSTSCGFATGGGNAFIQGGNTFGALATLGTNDSNALAFETNNVEAARFTTGGVFELNSTGTAGTVEKFRVNTPTTVDNLANAIISTSATTSKGLVVQGVASQAANLQEWQSSAGGVMTYVASNGEVLSNTGFFRTLRAGAVDVDGLQMQNGSAAWRAMIQGGTSFVLRDITNSRSPLTIAQSTTSPTVTIGSGSGLQVTNFADQAALIAKGVSGQTANLQQWQDSTGAILTAIDASGKLLFGPSGAQDTNLYRAAADSLGTDDRLIFNLATNGSEVINAKATGDANNRFRLALQATGAAMIWGDGTALGDTNLYRSAADTLKTDDDLQAQRLGIGTAPASGFLAQLGGTHPSTATGTYGLVSQWIGPSTSTTAIISGYFEAKTQAAAFTTAQLIGIQIASPTIGAGSSASATYGLKVETQPTYGVTIAAAGVHTLWLSSTSNSTASSGGITFGSSEDTNLYRSAADTLKTDDSLVVVGTYNTNTFTGAALTFGTAGAATIQSASSQALNITGHTNSTFSTDAGTFTLQGFSTTTLASANQSAGSTNSANVVIASGNAAGATSTAGNITLDVGTSTTSNGSILIGTAARAQTITIGNSTGGAVRVGQNGGTLQLDGTNFDVSTAGVVTLIGGQTQDINTAGAATATAIILQPGTSSGASSNGAATTIRGGDGSGTTTVVGGALTLQGGNATGGSGTRTGGAVTLDAGYGGAAGTNGGAVSIGTTNASGITLGRNTTTTINVGRLTNSHSDADTTLWNRVDDVDFYNINGTNNTWTGIGFNDGDSLAAGIAAQYYNTASDYARLVFSTRGSSGFTTNNMVLENGKVGIGAAPSTYRLEVTDAQTTNYVARIQNTDTSNTADGLLIDLGVANASRGTGNYFVGFSGGGTVAGKIQGGASAVAYTTTAADYAEYFKADPNKLPQAGELVMLNQDQSHQVLKSNNNAKAPLVGVVSTNPGFIGNGPLCDVSDNDCDANYAKYNVLIALSGQVPVKVNTTNGSIGIGDPIMSSGVIGEGAKATSAGYIVGYAMEPLTGSSGTIKVLIRPQYFVPNDSGPQAVVQSSNSNDIAGDLNVSGKATVSNLVVTNTITAKSLVVTGGIQASTITVTGLLTTKDLTVTHTLVAQNVTVHGSAEFEGDIVLAGPINTKQNAITKRFKASGALTAGSVVVLDSANDGYVTTTITSQDTKVVGVAVSSTASMGDEITVAIGGQVQVAAGPDSAISSGDLLTSDATAGLARSEANPRVGSILGKATSKKDDQTNKVWVLLTLQ